MIKKWKLLKKKKIFNHKYFSVFTYTFERPNSKKIDWTISPRDNSVVVFALDKNKNVIMIRQYRQGIDMIEIAFPAGHIKKNTTPLINAKWELEEEGGYISTN